MVIKLKNGLDIPIVGEPEQAILGGAVCKVRSALGL
jgi:Na+-transporting NADH:ubiquinone oxidoreductase subunit NqrA